MRDGDPNRPWPESESGLKFEICEKYLANWMDVLEYVLTKYPEHSELHTMMRVMISEALRIRHISCFTSTVHTSKLLKFHKEVNSKADTIKGLREQAINVFTLAAQPTGNNFTLDDIFCFHMWFARERDSLLPSDTQKYQNSLKEKSQKSLSKYFLKVVGHNIPNECDFAKLRTNAPTITTESKRQSMGLALIEAFANQLKQ
ncbi:unnamed protein product [Medioppia subpectinata]|uniref:Uncharacterized protein n=1 Tax=Medioppia subpectinata TaxID=1979941 RepID=A0A7R9LMN8_9ACAR|nr:unnamed protein product [Medioppia subpectinata]CAG2120066.1 unnamed protein product [Medioppia subpectinata]